MKCPKCKQDLQITGQERLETLDEHVSNPNGTPSLKNLWQCVNTQCQCFRAFGWDDYGDFYSLDYPHKTQEVFPDNDYSAIGSFARKMDVEIYKKGLPKKKYLHPIFMLGFFQPYIEWHGMADEDGNILKKWWTIGILKKDGFNGRYCIYATFCWHTWSFLWKKFKKDIDAQNYNRAFERSLNNDWPYRWFNKFIRFRYFNLVPDESTF